MAAHEPTDEQLLDALRSIKSDHPEFGVKRLLDELKTRHPEWNVLKQRVKDAHAPPNPGASRDREQPRATSSQPARSSDTHALFKQQIVPLDALARSGQRVPISRSHTSALSESISVMRTFADSKFGTGLQVFEYYLDGKDVSELQGLLYAPFRRFRAEWRAYTPLARPVAHHDDVEALLFPDLFPYGTGHYVRRLDLSFEEYAMHCLRIFDPRFRNSKEWLLWVLCRTQNEELTIAINCVLAVKHAIEGRHLGEGKVVFESMGDQLVKKPSHPVYRLLVSLFSAGFVVWLMMYFVA